MNRQKQHRGGDKTADCPLDLEKDAIHPVVDGGYVCAEGTPLGGDDGIAVAYALAVLDAKMCIRDSPGIRRHCGTAGI